MTWFFVTLFGLLASFRNGLRDPEFRVLFVSLVGLLATGTVFYSAIEGWGFVDALYFCVMTLATVGFGDLHPTTPLSKLFTVVYVLVGAGIFVGFVTKVTQHRRNRV